MQVCAGGYQRQEGICATSDVLCIYKRVSDVREELQKTEGKRLGEAWGSRQWIGGEYRLRDGKDPNRACGEEEGLTVEVASKRGRSIWWAALAASTDLRTKRPTTDNN